MHTVHRKEEKHDPRRCIATNEQKKKKKVERRGRGKRHMKRHKGKRKEEEERVNGNVFKVFVKRGR